MKKIKIVKHVLFCLIFFFCFSNYCKAALMESEDDYGVCTYTLGEYALSNDNIYTRYRSEIRNESLNDFLKKQENTLRDFIVVGPYEFVYTSNNGENQRIEDVNKNNLGETFKFKVITLALDFNVDKISLQAYSLAEDFRGQHVNTLTLNRSETSDKNVIYIANYNKFDGSLAGYDYNTYGCPAIVGIGPQPSNNNLLLDTLQPYNDEDFEYWSRMTEQETPIVFYSSDAAQYLNGTYNCAKELDTSTVSAITKNFSLLDTILSVESEDEYKEIVKQIVRNGSAEITDSFTQKIIDLPYFDSKSPDSVRSKAGIDLEKLKKFKESFQNCGLSDLSWFDKHPSTNSPGNVNFAIAVLEMINELDDNSLKLLLEYKNYKDMNNALIGECPGVPEGKPKTECKKNVLKEMIKSLNCENSKICEKNCENTVIIKIIDEFNNTCQSSGAYYDQCKKNECRNLKNSDANINKLIEKYLGESEQKFLKEINVILSKSIPKLISQSGIKFVATDQFCDTVSSQLGEYITLAMNWVRIGGVLLVIALSLIDAIRYVATIGDNDGQKKFFKNLYTRLILLLILLILPSIINWIIKFFLNEVVCYDLIK